MIFMAPSFFATLLMQRRRPQDNLPEQGPLQQDTKA